MSLPRNKSAAAMHNESKLSSPSGGSESKTPSRSKSVSAMKAESNSPTRTKSASAMKTIPEGASPSPHQPSSAMPTRRKIAFEDLKKSTEPDEETAVEKAPSRSRSVRLPKASSHSLPNGKNQSESESKIGNGQGNGHGDKGSNGSPSKFPNVSFRDFKQVQEVGEDDEEAQESKKGQQKPSVSSEAEDSSKEVQKNESGLLKYSHTMTPKEGSKAQKSSGNVGINLKSLVHSETVLPEDGESADGLSAGISLYEQQKLDKAKEELPEEEEPLYFGIIDYKKWSPLHVATKYSTRYSRLGK